jgi:hypothetical protein
VVGGAVGARVGEGGIDSDAHFFALEKSKGTNSFSSLVGAGVDGASVRTREKARENRMTVFS